MKTLKNHTALYLLTFIMLMVLSMVSYYPFRYLFRSTLYHYPGFGVTVPVPFAIHGIDVSHYQSSINWKDVRQMQYEKIKIGFSFIKATEGSGIEDEYFEQNWNEARKASIPIGAYHYFIPGISGKLQALNYIKSVDLEKNDLPPVLDVEQINDISTDTMIMEIQEWLDMMENEYCVKPIIYTNVDFYNDYLRGYFDAYPLWIANYNSENVPSINRDWLFWQHSSEGHVNGINGNVDLNVFNGDSASFKTIFLK